MSRLSIVDGLVVEEDVQIVKKKIGQELCQFQLKIKCDCDEQERFLRTKIVS